MKNKPVYMINGFLEAGKTEFISFTISQPYFQIKGKTLLVVCEEGENEYDKDLLKKTNTEMVLIESEEDFSTTNLSKIEKQYKPDRIIIEYNGIWNFKNCKLPWNWNCEQQITLIDASTFTMYYTNMRSLLAEMIRNSEMIIFNRCDTVRNDLATYRRNIKAVNPGADVVFEDSQGEINEIFEEDLPYDLSKDEIVLDNNSYGIWYLDCMDHLERYEGKKLTMQVMVMHPDKFPKGYFIPGRMAMTCCAADMAYIGYACEYADNEKFKDKDWIVLTAVLKKEYFADYKGEGPVLHAISVEKSKEPKDAVISFGG